VSNKPEETFRQFWNKYPRRVAKKAAIKAWIELDPNDALIREIIEALAWQSELIEELRFFPHPATWLRSERWEDEKPTPKTINPSIDHLPAWHRASILGGRREP
jgi:hypothetical protein